MELKVFRDVLPAGGRGGGNDGEGAKAELPLETELLISDYLPPVQRIVACQSCCPLQSRFWCRTSGVQKQLAPGRLTLEGYLRFSFLRQNTVYYQGEREGRAVSPDRAEAVLPADLLVHQGPRAAGLLAGASFRMERWLTDGVEAVGREEFRAASPRARPNTSTAGPSTPAASRCGGPTGWW